MTWIALEYFVLPRDDDSLSPFDKATTGRRGKSGLRIDMVLDNVQRGKFISFRESAAENIPPELIFR